MKVKICVFSFLRDKLGWKEKIMELPKNEATLHEILSNLPDLKKYVLRDNNNLSDEFMILVNGLNVKFTGGNKTIVKDGDEIAIFPPGGGG